MTIDMKNFAGETQDSAAGGQNVDTSQPWEMSPEDAAIHKQVLGEVPQATPAEVVPPVEPVEVVKEPSEQELNFKAFREEIDRIKAEREEFKQNLEILRANVQQQTPRREEPAPKKFLDGMEDNDIPNVKEIRSAWDQREKEYVSRIEELQVAQQHPDYAEVLEKYLTPLIRQKPHLAEGIQGASNKALFAYELGKMYQQQQIAQAVPPPVAPQATPPSETAKRIVENARKPGTLAQAGGQGALSKADYFATMSDEDFMRMASKNLEGI
jgi:hypothetical protein